MWLFRLFGHKRQKHSWFVDKNRDMSLHTYLLSWHTWWCCLFPRGASCTFAKCHIFLKWCLTYIQIYRYTCASQPTKRQDIPLIIYISPPCFPLFFLPKYLWSFAQPSPYTHTRQASPYKVTQYRTLLQCSLFTKEISWGYRKLNFIWFISRYWALLVDSGVHKGAWRHTLTSWNSNLFDS